MQFFGKKKPDAKEVLKQETRNMKRTEREIERERLGLQRQEQKLIAEVKKAAKDGQTGAVKTLAKQLVQTRNAMARMGMMKSQVSGAATQMKLNHTQASMAQSLAGVSAAMGKMNEAVDPAKMMQIMKEFERENEQMDLKQEMMDDALDNLFDDDVLEGEADAVTEQVLAEIGIDVAGQMAGYACSLNSKL
eukprot:Tamp_17395.p1 GENE.Tamp_17395~~Tamp_17395.p1  ORF type:complete len:214 (+),score=77.36 Tamp_17395:72-644(+)